MIPLLQLPQVPGRAKTAEFTQLFTWGAQYLQPSSQILGVSLATLACWSYLVARESGVWKYYVASFVILAPLAIWEVVYIFPINDRVKEMDDRLRVSEGASLDAKEEEELKRLLQRWSAFHVARFAAPLIAGAITAVALVRTV